MAGMTCPASKNERPPHFGQTLPRRWCDRGAPLARVGGVSERSPVAPTWHSILFERRHMVTPCHRARTKSSATSARRENVRKRRQLEREVPHGHTTCGGPAARNGVAVR